MDEYTKSSGIIYLNLNVVKMYHDTQHRLENLNSIKSHENRHTNINLYIHTTYNIYYTILSSYDIGAFYGPMECLVKIAFSIII